jgi:protein O-mannosyl-transferase
MAQTMFRCEQWTKPFLIAVSFAALLLQSPSFASPFTEASNAEQMQAAATQAIQSGRFQHARDLVQKALGQNPEAVELWNLLGVAQSELHQGEAARKAFQRGLQLAPNSVSLNENLGFLFFREADYGRAKQYLQKAVTLGSQNPGVHFSLAAAKLRTGERAEALKELKSIQRPLKNLSDYWVERGTAELPESSAEAERSFTRAIEIDPDNLAALNGAASVAEQQGLDERALALLMQARRSHPDDVPTLLHFGTVCLRRDLGIDALEAAQKAYQLQPRNDYGLYLLARANISQQNWQPAYELFHQFAVRRPGFAPAYYAMGWLDIKLDKTENAKHELQRCLELDPELSDARAELAQLDLENGELETAQQLFEKVLQQNPGNAKANTGMGDLMLRKGSLEEAQRYLEAAITADPKEGSAHYKLSQVLLRKHDVERANKERTLALALNSEAKRASKAPLRLAMPDNSTLP